MKVALMTGAYKNAGDFLIEERCKRILEENIHNCNINIYKRRDIRDCFDEINQNDVLVFSGGPLYQCNPESAIPLDGMLKFLNPKIMFIGGGWYGRGKSSKIQYEYRFSEFGKKLFSLADQEYGLACRDLPTFRVLKNNGFKNVYLTGCPAWYSIEDIETEKIRDSWNIKKICVSNPAGAEYFDDSFNLVMYLQKKFPNARIVYIFHRGIGIGAETNEVEAEQLSNLKEKLDKCSIETHDISFGSDGFSLYEDCQLHVGYRVHAHIYCLSRRKRTILVEEDGRGFGVNETLGLPSITAYNDTFTSTNRYINKIHSFYDKKNNASFIEEVDSYLELLKSTDDLYLENAYKSMKHFYKEMQKYINQINKG